MFLLHFALLAFQSPTVTPQGAPATGGAREAMWYAPTAADWQKPVLIQFQRSWEDALAVARETKKPILVCVNMDGEIASEHYAGVRYRDAEKARLYEPYVCVIASVYRHAPRDYDDEGRRVLCPRFGSVTCGEHIAIEPVLYEQFMDKKRIAPRHIAIDLEEKSVELYDVYLAFDTDSVFTAIREGVKNRPAPLPIGERPLEDKAASRDIAERTRLERAYVTGDRTLRKSILESTLKFKELDHADVLRLALFGLDVELARAARKALAETDSEKAVDLIVDVLRAPLEAGERDLLLAALDRLGAKYPRARTLAAVQQGLAKPSTTLDLGGWAESLAGAEYPAPSERTTIEARLEAESRRSLERPADPAVQLDLAEAALALAVDPTTAQILAADRRTADDFARLQFEDVRRATEAAAASGASGWRVEALRALSAWYLGEEHEAEARAEQAVAALPAGEPSWNAMAVLALYARARERAVLAALREQRDWPKEWLADVNATYEVLLRHPHGAEQHPAAHFDFLWQLGARARAATVLEAGLERFPGSWMLHARLRGLTLEQRGIEGLGEEYATRLAKPHDPALDWFAGYAGLVTAEYYRRAGNASAASAAYEQSIAHYERSIERNPASRANSDYYVAMALGGRARLSFEHGENERAGELLVASFTRQPDAASALDGLNLSAVDTARAVLQSARAAGQRELVTRVEAALAALDPRPVS
ncbi:MAG: hypothetical protein ABL998_17985, partial [Planctomycetota bacterium]